MERLQEILKQLPTAFGQSLMNYGIIVIIYLVVWKLLKKRLKNWRIQLKERVDAKQIKSELLNSLFTLMVSTVFVLAIYLLKSLGYTKIYTDINEYPKFFAYSGFSFFYFLTTLGFTGYTAFCITHEFSSTFIRYTTKVLTLIHLHHYPFIGQKLYYSHFGLYQSV